MSQRKKHSGVIMKAYTDATSSLRHDLQLFVFVSTPTIDIEP